MKKTVTSITTILFTLILAITMTPFSALANITNDDFDDYYYQIDDNVIETPIVEGGTITVEGEENSGIQPNGLYSYTVTNINKTQCNYFKGLTNWAQGACTLTYSRSTTFSISAELSTGVDVPLDVLTTKLGVKVGASYSLSANEQVSYQIPKGYKGRIVMRYYQILYRFDWSKKLAGIKIKSGSGSIYGKPYNPYYARQLISLN